MKRFCYRFLLCLAAISGPVLLGAAPPSEVECLVEQLGSDKFTEREAALAFLIPNRTMRIENVG
jgi:hypothetical protein